jgi:hypothetical protein
MGRGFERINTTLVIGDGLGLPECRVDAGWVEARTP